MGERGRIGDLEDRIDALEERADALAAVVALLLARFEEATGQAAAATEAQKKTLRDHLETLRS